MVPVLKRNEEKRRGKLKICHSSQLGLAREERIMKRLEKETEVKSTQHC